MSMRGDTGRSGGYGEPSDRNNNDNDDPNDDANLMSDDDNAQEDLDDNLELEEDPLLLAIDDLEGRVVSALDECKVHPGIRTDPTLYRTVHEELAVVLRPVLEVAAHTGPSVARTYYRGGDRLEADVASVYERLVENLVLPVLLEMAQSETVAAKRGAALEFFGTLYRECHKAGSWLDSTTTHAATAGPYGPGGSQHHQQQQQQHAAMTPALRALGRRRAAAKLQRDAELLRYWTAANVACLVPGVLTETAAAATVAARGIVAASAALRPALTHVATRIKDADDRGAARLYGPVMKMVQMVLRQLFLSSSFSRSESEAVRAACVKFLEIVVLCCSRKPPDVVAHQRGRGRGQSTGFSLDDLPTGHPVITREALESIAEYAFTTLRGMTMMGGQVKIDANMLTEMTENAERGSPSEQVVSILKPAALAYLEIYSSVPKSSDEDSVEFEIDHSSVEFDFLLSQKSYALTINAMSALAMSRPVFFKESSTCLARRAVNPPVYTPGGDLPRAVVLAVSSQLRAACLTLLRNATSITTGASNILHTALVRLDMELQADKALKMANQANSLKTAGRAERNQAKMFYEWDASESANRSTKRQRETDDALAKMRASKKARGLGHGIQLPTSMADATELILANLTHIPSKRPSSSKSSSGSKRAPSQQEVSLDFVIDAIMTNGASLAQEEGRWYEREGGAAWEVDVSAAKVEYRLDSTVLKTVESIKENKQTSNEKDKQFLEQCNSAASDAMGRILATSLNSRSKGIADLGNQLAARLAFTLQKVQPAVQQEPALVMAKDSITSLAKVDATEDEKRDMKKFVESHPLFASSLSLHATANADQGNDFASSLSSSLLNEAILQACQGEDMSKSDKSLQMYELSLDLFIAATVRAGELADEKPNDVEKKKAAAQAAVRLQKCIASVPRLTTTSLKLIGSMCDIEGITKRASEASRKTRTSQESIAVSASIHAAKMAAEKRATAALVMLRDVAFQHETVETRKAAVDCAVGIAAGRLGSPPSVHEKALKLTMNVLFAKNESLADLVVQAALNDLKWAANYAIDHYDDIKKANEEASKKDLTSKHNPLSSRSEVEKQVLERMKKPSILIMALCVRRPEAIKELFALSCQKQADVLSKAVRLNMSKLTKAMTTNQGAATVALQVADMVGRAEVPMLLAFLENLAPSNEKALPDADIIHACLKIQESKVEDGKKDPRFLIPIVSAMKRKELVELLPQFIAADDNILLAALVRMGDRVGRQALLFREEPDEENPTLHGMTLCEQLVYLHKLNFAAAGLPQKRYLAAIKLCLEDEEVYNDRVLMAALDEMSGTFLTGAEKLPLAFMRTNILVCTKHESLHSWICHVLLPRLIEGQIWSDPRQWEGWMRCAHMLEKSEDPNVSSVEAIGKLPPDQLVQYRAKWVKR